MCPEARELRYVKGMCKGWGDRKEEKERVGMVDTGHFKTTQHLNPLSTSGEIPILQVLVRGKTTIVGAKNVRYSFSASLSGRGVCDSGSTNLRTCTLFDLGAGDAVCARSLLQGWMLHCPGAVVLVLSAVSRVWPQWFQDL